MTAANSRHIALRMCVICRERLPKRELTRYVGHSQPGHCQLDEKQRLEGRGFYLCGKTVCREKFARLAQKSARSNKRTEA